MQKLHVQSYKNRIVRLPSINNVSPSINNVSLIFISNAVLISFRLKITEIALKMEVFWFTERILKLLQ
jgi:hypothetical protein